MQKVSIVIPVYNTSKYLIRCLDSVRVQTLEDIEVIIVNDGSTDESESLCRDYITHNNLTWALYTKENGGLSSARRYGWERSNSECIAFVDSDDELSPDYCKQMYESMSDTDSQLAICGYFLCNDSTKTEHLPEFSQHTIENILVNYAERIIFDNSEGSKIPGFLWMRMMKRELITEDCFINENIVFAEDQIFDLTYCKAINKISIVPNALYYYYINPGSLTLKYRPNMLEMTVNLNSFYSNFLESKNLLDKDANLKLAKNEVGGIISSIVNSMLFGNFIIVKKLLKKIRSHHEYRKSFDFLKKNSCLTRYQKIWWLIINNGFGIIPYSYYYFRHPSGRLKQ